MMSSVTYQLFSLAATPFGRLLPLIVALLTTGVWSASVPGCPEDVPIPESPSEWTPRNPEQTMYAYVRCLNDSSASVDMKIRWVRWQPDGSPESQCYVKCVSEELRLFDVKERRFRPERFVQQAESFANDDSAELDKLRTNAETMLAGPLEDISCATVFFKYANFYTTHTTTILKMFHGDHRDLIKTYQKLGDHVKQIGQTFVDYCEKLHGASWNSDESCPSSALVDCILRGFRWISEEGEVNVNEIRRDYRAAGFEAPLAATSGGCETSGKGGGARTLFGCLRDSGAAELSQVISERNQRTAFYFDATSQEEPWRSAVEFANQRMLL